MTDFQKRLESLLAKEELALTESEKKFIKARATYLTSEQVARYSFLSGVSQAQAPKPEEVVQPPKQPETPPTQPTEDVEVKEEVNQPQGIDTTNQ